MAALLAGVALSSCEPDPTTAPGDAGGSRLLLLVSDRNQSAGQFDIYLYDLDNLGFRQISGINAVNAADLNPTLSPEGRFIAFQSTRVGGVGGSDIYLYDRAIFNYTPLPGINTTADETEPFFAYNGRYLAFTQIERNFKQVRLLDGLPDTLIDLSGLNTSTSNNSAPSPNNDALRIAFVSDRNGNDDVFVYDSAGDSLLALPDLISPATDTEPWITPDGRFLCFASDRAGGAGGFDLYLYDMVALSFVTLAPALNTAQTERNPSLSNDGVVIVFESDRTGSVNNSMDLWNHDRNTGAIGQAPGESSSAADLQPSLHWP
ncbi:MAG TPA: hypothetical protein VEY91_06685 [Candidatus Limnocylindria bacterium]|nr:hypothetical protein [Candidatus Limnocylindria bacterium]